MSGSPSGVFKLKSQEGKLGCGIRSGTTDASVGNLPVWTCAGWDLCNQSSCCTTMILAIMCTDISGKYITPDEISQISAYTAGEYAGRTILDKVTMANMVNSASSYFTAQAADGIDENKVITTLSNNGRIGFCIQTLPSTNGKNYWDGSKEGTGHWLAIYKRDTNGNYYCYDGGGNSTLAGGDIATRATFPISFSAIKQAIANRSNQVLYINPASGKGANLSGGGSASSGSGSSSSSGGSGITVSSTSYFSDISDSDQSKIKAQIDAMIAAGAAQGINMAVEGDSLVVDYSSHLKDYVKYANVKMLKGLQYHPNSLGRFNFKQDYIVIIRKKLYFAATMASNENFLRLYQVNNFSAITVKTSVAGEATCNISLKGGEKVVCINRNDEEDKNWQSYEELLNGLTNIDDEATTGDSKWRIGSSDWDSPTSLGVDYKNLMKAREAKYGWRIAEKCDWQPMDEITVYSQSRTKRNASGQFTFEKIFFGYIDSIKKQFDSQGPIITIQATDQLKLLKNSYVNKSPSFQPGRFNNGYLDISFATSETGLIKITEPFQAIFSAGETSEEAIARIKTQSTFSEIFSGLFPDLIIAQGCLAAGIPASYLVTRIEPVKVIPYIFKLTDGVNYQSSEFKSRLDYCQEIAELCLMEFFQDEEGNIVFKIPSYVLGANNLTANNMGYELNVEVLRENNFAPFDKSYAISLERIQEGLKYCKMLVYTCENNETLRTISLALYGSDLYSSEIKYLNVGTCQGYGINDTLPSGTQLLLIKYDISDKEARDEYLETISNTRVMSYATALYNQQSGISSMDNYSGLTMSMMTDALIPETPPEEIVSFTLSDTDKEVYNSIEVNGITYMGVYEGDEKTAIKRTVPDYESIMRFGVRVAPSVTSPLIYRDDNCELFGHCLLAKSAAGRFTATVSMIENPDIRIGNPIRLFTYDEHPNMETGIWSTETYPAQSVYYINSISRSIKTDGVSTMTLDLVAGRVMGEESIYDKLFVAYRGFYEEPNITDPEILAYAKSKYQSSWDEIQSGYGSVSINNDSSDSGSSDSDDDIGDGSFPADGPIAFSGSTNEVTGKTIQVPNDGYIGSQMVIEKYSSVNALEHSTRQWKILEASGRHFDSDGFLRVDGRYALALSCKFGRPGDKVKVEFRNGQTFLGLFVDSKNNPSEVEYKNTWGHLDGKQTLEFIVKDSEFIISEGVYKKDVAQCHPEWANTTVKQITNQGPWSYTPKS